MAVIDDTFEADCLGHLLENIQKQSAEAFEKLATNTIKTTGGVFLEIGAKTGKEALSWNPKAALSTIADVINWYHTGESFCLETFL